MPNHKDFNNKFNYVYSCINCEGFDYTFMHYDWFSCVDDKQFHKLRKEYQNAHKNLEKYIMERTDDEYHGYDDEVDVIDVLT